MQFQNATITPQYAKYLLDHNRNNRKIRASMVSRYAAMMLAGRWVENGDVIRISDTGQLLDGQHRLMAVVESGVSIRCGIASGLKDSVFTTLDTGGVRTAADAARLAGIASAKGAASVAAAWWRMMVRAPLGLAVPPDYVVETLRRWPEIGEAVQRSNANYTARTLATASSVSLGYLYLNDIANLPDEAEHFVTGLQTGEGLLSGDPVLALRQRLINLRSDKHASAKPVWGLVVRALDALEAGERRSILRPQIKTSAVIDRPAKFDQHVSLETPERRLADLTSYTTGSAKARVNQVERARLAAE